MDSLWLERLSWLSYRYVCALYVLTIIIIESYQNRANELPEVMRESNPWSLISIIILNHICISGALPSPVLTYTQLSSLLKLSLFTNIDSVTQMKTELAKDWQRKGSDVSQWPNWLTFQLNMHSIWVQSGFDSDFDVSHDRN